MAFEILGSVSFVWSLKFFLFLGRGRSQHVLKETTASNSKKASYAIVSSDGIFCVLGSHKTRTFASYINLTSYQTAKICFVCFLIRIRDDLQVRIWIRQTRKTSKIISKMFYGNSMIDGSFVTLLQLVFLLVIHFSSIFGPSLYIPSRGSSGINWVSLAFASSDKNGYKTNSMSKYAYTGEIDRNTDKW